MSFRVLVVEGSLCWIRIVGLKGDIPCLVECADIYVYVCLYVCFNLLNYGVLVVLLLE